MKKNKPGSLRPSPLVNNYSWCILPFKHEPTSAVFSSNHTAGGAQTCMFELVNQRAVIMRRASPLLYICLILLTNLVFLARAQAQAPNPVDIIAQKPTAYWRFGEPRGASTMSDSSINGFHGVYLGSTTQGVPGIAGDGNTAMAVDGRNGHAQALNIPVKRSFTALVWARSNTTQWNDYGWIWSSRSPNGFIIHPDQGKKTVGLYIIGKQGPTDYERVGTLNVADITHWHQYGIIYDEFAQTASLVLDGEIVSTSSYPASRRSFSGLIDVWFGSDSCCDLRNGSGAIDEAAMFDRAITKEDLASVFGRGTASTGQITACVSGRTAELTNKLIKKKAWIEVGPGLGGDTDASGCRVFSNLPLGTYTVRATLDGWAFGSAQYQNDNYTKSLTQTEPRTRVGVTGWDRDPIVFVHGWTSGPSDFARLPNEFSGGGYYTVSVNLQTSPLWTPPFSVNAKRVKEGITAAKKLTGREKVILYGQSMGGLVARSYLEGGMYEGDVSQIFTYGSPHLGTPSLLALGCYVLPRPDAVCQMTKPGMALFNLTHYKRDGVDYHLIAGDAPMWTHKKVCFKIFGKKICLLKIPWPDLSFRNAGGWATGVLILGPDDGFIQTCSASGMLGSNIDRYLTREVHSAPMLGGRDYHSWDGGVSQEGFAQCSKKLLLDRSALTCGARSWGPPLSCLGLSLASLKSAAANDEELLPAPNLDQLSRVAQTILRPGEHRVRSVYIEGGATAFSSSWTEGHVNFTLIDPTGKVIDPAYAASIQAETDESDAVVVTEPTPDTVVYSGDSMQAVYYFPATRPGTWQIVLDGLDDLPAEGASVTTAAGFDSPLSAGFSSDRISYEIGTIATLRVSLSEPVLDANVQVKVQYPGGNSEVISLTRLSANEFEAKYVVSGPSGYVAFDWSMTGQRSDGVAFERGGREFVQVQSTAVRLGHGHTDRALPRADVVELNSALVVSLRVISDYEGGELGAFAELTGSDGSVVARSSVSVPARRGTNDVELRFRAEDIYRSKMDGPYTVRNVRLLDSRAAPLLSQEIRLAHSTQSYTYRSFAPMRGTPLVLIEGPFRVRAGGSVALTAIGIDPEGEVLDYSWDLDADGIFEVSGQSVTFTPYIHAPVGLQTVRVKVADPEGNSVIAEASVEILLAKENRSPIARCRDVTMPAACGLKDSVNNGSYDPDPEDTLSCIQTPVGPYPVGSHLVTLTCTDSSGLSSSCEAMIMVIDPSESTLVLNGDSHISLECGRDTWVDPGAQAWDSCGPLQVHRYNSGDDDGDGIPGTQDPDDYGPGPNTWAEGSYPVEYIAWNTAGFTASAVRWVHVDDQTPPTLKLRGPAHMTHQCGSWWEDPGVEAFDACYGNVEPTVATTGYVNGWSQGTYTVLYEVRDSGGNSSLPVTRTVEVVDCPW
ncbi:immunoglobulin-like domain-containing protein [Archangium primigenium]|uniref:immunoglobulin-like domain-containing protein n=1 Tax=[Archangium] primigenium TaxID=2792470 RepID=UPI00195CC75C|nr:immunoglobulin-like domain-containing protein [Archangium primigenium]MBM7114429.1 DUF5011 domain-containing protein [Archangium primigenium]